MSSSRGQPRARGPSRWRPQRPVGPRGVGERPMAHLLSRSHHAPSRAGPPPGVEARRCERPALSRMTRDLQLVHYVPRSKGTMSEAELHFLRQRLVEARLNKARRGELFSIVRTGSVRLPGDRVALDPDEQVQHVVRLIFDKFDELGTVGALLRYLVRQDIKLGMRVQGGPD